MKKSQEKGRLKRSYLAGADVLLVGQIELRVKKADLNAARVPLDAAALDDHSDNGVSANTDSVED